MSRGHICIWRRTGMILGEPPAAFQNTGLSGGLKLWLYPAHVKQHIFRKRGIFQAMDSSKQTSFIFLSLLCFALADVRDGLGPFLGVYLQGQGWTPDTIGFVMTSGGLAVLSAPRHWGRLRIMLGTRGFFLAAALRSLYLAAAFSFCRTAQALRYSPIF